ncbi:hypothetical protein HanIR_Chr10g0453851 [Helianthus annuus]|nr:hypothetical protein HanIR_Chr10g0453851 [Helianthus annuus]
MHCVVFHLDAHRQKVRESSVRNTHTSTLRVCKLIVNIVLVTGTFIRINTVVLIGESCVFVFVLASSRFAY